VEIITFPQACLGVDFFALFQAFCLIFYRLFPSLPIDFLPLDFTKK